MRKYLVCLICLVSIFIFLDSVKAEDNNYYITKYYNRNTNEYVTNRVLSVSKEDFNKEFKFTKEDYINAVNLQPYKDRYLRYLNRYFEKINNGTFDTYLENYDYYLIANRTTSEETSIIFFNGDDIDLYCDNCYQNGEVRFYVSIKNGIRYNGYNNTYTTVTNMTTNFSPPKFNQNYNDNFVTASTIYNIYYPIYFSSENIISYLLTGKGEPKITYDISNATNMGKKLTINFANFNQTDYINIYNFYEGTTTRYEMNEIENNQIILDNLNVDTIIQVEVFNENDEFVASKNIDVYLNEESILDISQRYIQVVYNSKLKMYFLNTYNTKSSDTCYFKFAEEQEEQFDCNSNSIMITAEDKQDNSYFEVYIKNNNQIVLKRTINYNFNASAPKFSFESYFDNEESKQVLQVTVENLGSNDLIYYSFDNEVWNQMTTQRVSTLDFYSNTEVYFKVERSGNVISRAFYNVVYKAYENTSQEQNKGNALQNFFTYFLSIFEGIKTTPLNMFKTIYNYINNSKFGLYISFIFISSIFILILKSIKR